LCEQALIDHNTIYFDLPKIDGLVEKGEEFRNGEERFIEIWIKKGNTCDWDMGGNGILIQQVSFPFIIFLFFLFFGHELELLASICRDVSNVVNLDYPNVCVQACEQCPSLFKRIMPITM
jgi:hypothetical protein